MIIGICGKSGSGKSTIARLIAETKSQAIICNIDKIGHEVIALKEVQDELVKSFGQDIVDGTIVNRKKLAELVFISRSNMKKLTNITWKSMQAMIDSFIEDNKDKIIILDWILLSQTSYFDMCDIKILVDLPYEVRKERAMKRDNITEEEFDIREQASIDYEIRDFDIVVTDNNIDKIRRMVDQI